MNINKDTLIYNDPLWSPYLEEWITYKDLASRMLNDHEIHLTHREWTRTVERHNERYCDQETDQYIVHSIRGYMLTSDTKLIDQSLKDYRKRALNMLHKRSRAIKSMKLRKQHRLL